MKKLSILVSVLLVLALANCGGGAEEGAGNGEEENGGDEGETGEAITITGTVFAPNGTDPVAAATVYIPSSGSEMIVKNKAPTGKTVTGVDGVTTCDDPPETYCAATCSGPDGTFSFDTSNCTGTLSTLKIAMGTFIKTTLLNCTSTTCALSNADTTFQSLLGVDTPTMAVVTGQYDEIEDVLAKLGFGSLDPNWHLDLTKEFSFDLFDGTNSLDDTDYKNFSDLLDGTVAMSDYDVIFINCGTSGSHEFQIRDDPEVQTRLIDYVNNGGSLYVTDWSYDYIEQTFPNFMRYEGDTEAPALPGALDAAEQGAGGVTINAAVNDDTLWGWLKAVTVIQHDASTPGNPDNDCSSDDTYTLRTGALNPDDDTIPIGSFWPAWARMTSAHSGNGALSPTIWISSGEGVEFDGLVDRPLTVSASVGSSGGKITYTSYHTAEGCPTEHFWPQERVLQYLVFKAF